MDMINAYIKSSRILLLVYPNYIQRIAKLLCCNRLSTKANGLFNFINLDDAKVAI